MSQKNQYSNTKNSYKIINPLLATILPVIMIHISGDSLQYKQQSKKQKTKILFAQINYTYKTKKKFVTCQKCMSVTL